MKEENMKEVYTIPTSCEHTLKLVQSVKEVEGKQVLHLQPETEDKSCDKCQEGLENFKEILKSDAEEAGVEIRIP